jgi:hypothetical protein
VLVPAKKRFDEKFLTAVEGCLTGLSMARQKCREFLWNEKTRLPFALHVK